MLLIVYESSLLFAIFTTAIDHVVHVAVYIASLVVLILYARLAQMTPTFRNVHSHSFYPHLVQPSILNFSVP